MKDNLRQKWVSGGMNVEDYEGNPLKFRCRRSRPKLLLPSR